MATKKDYILLADALNAASQISVADDFQRGKVAGVKVAAEFIADALGRDNSRFDREQFLKAVNMKRA